MLYQALREYADLLDMSKEGSDPSAARRRRAYYQKNRNKILATNRMYRQRNRSVLSRKAKIYRRRVNSGMMRQRTRQRVGQGYIYTGYAM